MFVELDPADYANVRPLVRDLAAFNVILDAVIDGSSPAWVIGDDARALSCVFLATAEGCFLAGDPNSAGFIADLRALFTRAVTEPDYWQGGDSVHLCIPPGAWESRLVDVFPFCPPTVNPRQHYVCTAPAIPDWRAVVPEGYAVARINAALLAQPGLDIPPHIPGWMRSNWGSVEAFRERGFGFGVVHTEAQAVVSWTLADCISGDRCEIGIQTRSDYRRHGLATLVVAAALEHALSGGLREVGWHCNTDNLGSIGVAVKTGFVKERDYVHYVYVFEEARRNSALS